MAADPHVISALRDKAHDLRQAIVSYEEHLDRTRKELAVVTATLTIFERGGENRTTAGRPAHIRNLFKRGDLIALSREALKDAADYMPTRDIAVACLKARDYDAADPVLVRAMVGLLSNTLKKAVRRGEMEKLVLPRRKVTWRSKTL